MSGIEKACFSPHVVKRYDRAIGLAEDPGVREFLLQKRAQLSHPRAVGKDVEIDRSGPSSI